MNYNKYICPICDNFIDGDDCWDTQADINEYAYQLLELFEIAITSLVDITQLQAGDVECIDIVDAAIATLKTRVTELNLTKANDLLERTEEK